MFKNTSKQRIGDRPYTLSLLHCLLPLMLCVGVCYAQTAQYDLVPSPGAQGNCILRDNEEFFIDANADGVEIDTDFVQENAA